MTSWKQKNVCALCKMMHTLLGARQEPLDVQLTFQPWEFQESGVKGGVRYHNTEFFSDALSHYMVCGQLFVQRMKSSAYKCTLFFLRPRLKRLETRNEISGCSPLISFVKFKLLPKTFAQWRLSQYPPFPDRFLWWLLLWQLAVNWSTQLKHTIMWHEARTKRQRCTAAPATKSLELCSTWLQSRTLIVAANWHHNVRF